MMNTFEFACIHNDLPLVKRLASIVDVNQRFSNTIDAIVWDSKNGRSRLIHVTGATSLHVAALNRNMDMFKFLLLQGADLNIQCMGLKIEECFNNEIGKFTRKLTIFTSLYTLFGRDLARDISEKC